MKVPVNLPVPHPFLYHVRVARGNPPKGRNTSLMRKVNGAHATGPRPPRAAPPPSKSNTGLIVGICAVLGVGAIVGLVAMNSGKKDPPPKKKEKKVEVIEAPTEDVGPPKTAGGFETNARYMIGKDAPRFDPNPELESIFGPAALSGDFKKLITADHALDHMKIAFTNLIGEDDKLALASFRFIQAFFGDERVNSDKKMQVPKDMGENFKLAKWRAEFYKEWAGWPLKADNIAVTRDRLDPEAAAKRAEEEKGKIDLNNKAIIEDVSDETWDRWMIPVRLGAREGELGQQRMDAISLILNWGRPGIEKLIAQIGDEDFGLARGSVQALNDIVAALPAERGGGKEFQTPEPRTNNREAIQAQWKEWFTRNYKDP